MNWAVPATDAPISFLFWGALFGIASVTKRKTCIPKSIIGYADIFPHLFIKFVGPPGIRKTASVENFILPLIKHDPTVSQGASFFTKETFMTDLAAAPDASCSLVVGEFGELMQKNKPQEMYDFLIKLFDGGTSDKLDVKTFKRNHEIAHKPCVNMIAATTKSWIAENMSANALGGGYSSRVIYVSESKLRDNGKLVYRQRLKAIGVDRKEYEDKLIDDMLHISSIKGDFDFSDEVEDYMNVWYNSHKILADNCPERLQGYYARKPLMIQKISMLDSLSRSNDLQLTKENWDFGVQAIETTEENLSKIFSSVGKNQDITTIYDIEDFVNRNGEVPYQTMIKEFLKDGNEIKIIELMNTCLSAGLITGKVLDDGTKVVCSIRNR